jgi:hypothetical protein
VKHLSGAPFCGRLLALPTNIRLGWKRNVDGKHSSLLRQLVNYGQKKSYNIGPRTKNLCADKHSSLFWDDAILFVILRL